LFMLQFWGIRLSKEAARFATIFWMLRMITTSLPAWLLRMCSVEILSTSLPAASFRAATLWRVSRILPSRVT
jgi:hypothetical protein